MVIASAPRAEMLGTRGACKWVGSGRVRAKQAFYGRDSGDRDYWKGCTCHMKTWMARAKDPSGWGAQRSFRRAPIYTYVYVYAYVYMYKYARGILMIFTYMYVYTCLFEYMYV